MPLACNILSHGKYSELLQKPPDDMGGIQIESSFLTVQTAKAVETAGCERENRQKDNNNNNNNDLQKERGFTMAIVRANCTSCNREFNVTDMVFTPSPKRGMRGKYMCCDCATRNEPYHVSNDKQMGTAKVNLRFCGIENETSDTDEFARNQMFEYGFIATRDGSLESDGNENRYGWRDGNTCEYVSPLMSGLNIASKFALTCERLMRDGHMKTNDSCGTHFHASINSMKNAEGKMVYNDYIRRYYHSLFIPLTSAMKENPEATANLFGRYFNDSYAEEITANSNPYDNRYLWINMTNDSNIEFRINKLVSAKQYQAVMKMEMEMVECIIANFCEHFMRPHSEIDSRRYYRTLINGERRVSRDAYRKHKADVTAKKLVAIYKKYAGI